MFLPRPVSTEEHVPTVLLYAAVKIKVAHIHATKALEMYFHSSLTWELDGGGWSTSRPGCFVPMKESWYSLNRNFCGPQEKRKIFAPAEYRTTDLPARNIVTVLTTPV